MNRRQRGAALLLVLWATMLLAALLVGVAAASRSQSSAALYGAQRVRAQLAAEAGLAHAVAGLRAPDLRAQWVPDGRPYTFAFDAAKVTVRVMDVSGLVDLNAASPELLRKLFEVAGVRHERAVQLADAIVGWRSGTVAPTQTALAAAGTTQTHGPFRVVEQLARLPGMDIDLYRRVERALTVFSGRNFPDASYAGPLVLAALEGMGVDQAETRVEARQVRPAQRGAGNGRGFGAVDNGPLVAGYGGVVERVFSTAEMPDGTRASIDVTIRLALTGGRARPYKVLNWRLNRHPESPRAGP